MTKELSMTEKYTLLMLYGGGSRTDFMACQYTAGIVLGGLYELLQTGQITAGKGGKLTAAQRGGNINECQMTLYNNICSHSAKSLQGWLEHYCFSATSKSVRPVVEDVLNTLIKKGYIGITWHRGLFRQKRSILIHTAQAAPVIEAFVTGVQSGQNSDEIIFCAEMLLLADVFKSYFPMRKGRSVKSILSGYKHSDIWKQMEPYADAVRNFYYQNTVYTGVS